MVMKTIQEFIKENYYNANGKAISARWKESWHIKNSYTQQWKEIHKLTAFLDDVEHEFKDRVTYVIKKVYEPNNCIKCGQHAGWMYDKGEPYVKQHCSKACSVTSDTRAEKIKQTHLTKVDQVEADRKRRETGRKRYGYDYHTQTPEARAHNSKRNLELKNPPERLELLLNMEKIIKEYEEDRKPTTVIADEIGIDRISIVNRLKKAGVKIRGSNGNRSWEERQLFDFIYNIDDSFNHSKHVLTGNREIDIYSGRLKLGIEYNGLFWHSSQNREDELKKKYFHIRKTNDAHAIGIDLYHIDSYLWMFKESIVKSWVMNKLGKSPNKVYARKCKLITLSGSQSKEFFDENHFQGYTQCSVTYGLEYEREIVAAMGFGKPRFSKKYEWELTRFANTKYTNVIGGASRLFKHFLKRHEGTIVTYADLAVSKGKLYTNLGFEHINTTRPGYMWTDGTVLYNRTSFMKKYLEKKLPNYNAELSETDNMYANGFRKYFNCGNMVFVYNR